MSTSGGLEKRQLGQRRPGRPRVALSKSPCFLEPWILLWKGREMPSRQGAPPPLLTPLLPAPPLGFGADSAFPRGCSAQYPAQPFARLFPECAEKSAAPPLPQAGDLDRTHRRLSGCWPGVWKDLQSAGRGRWAQFCNCFVLCGQGPCSSLSICSKAGGSCVCVALAFLAVLFLRILTCVATPGPCRDVCRKLPRLETELGWWCPVHQPGGQGQLWWAPFPAAW